MVGYYSNLFGASRREMETWAADHAASATISAPRTRSAAKGSYGRRLLRSVVRNGRRWELHATKGWKDRGRV